MFRVYSRFRVYFLAGCIFRDCPPEVDKVFIFGGNDSFAPVKTINVDLSIAIVVVRIESYRIKLDGITSAALSLCIIKLVMTCVPAL